MRFNVSRILVRIRQFWTRERLIPVLGFTALALFLLNFWAFLGHQFNQVPPLSASSVFGGSFFANSPDRHVHGGTFIYDSNRHDYKHRHRHFTTKRKRCDSEKNKRQSYETYFEVKRFNEEAKRFQDHADQYRLEIDRLQKEVQNEKVREILNELKHEIHTKDRKIVIKKLGDGSEMDVRVLIDGEVVVP